MIILVFLHIGHMRLVFVPSTTGMLYVVQQPILKCHYPGCTGMLSLRGETWVSHFLQTALVTAISKSEHLLLR